MPELPEVERARKLAERTLVGRRIRSVASVRDSIVYDGATPRKFASALRDRTVLTVKRKGKYLWFELDRRPWPGFHLGMTGAFVVYRAKSGRPRFWKVELLTDDGTRLAMRNARRLGRIRLHDDPEREPPVCRLGFDALLAMPPPAPFAVLVRRRNTSIKALLLDQSFAAGVGNWIADEVLFHARIAPARRASDLSPREIQRLRTKLGYIVRRAVEVNADKDRFPRTWLFHRRWGKNSDAVTAGGCRIIHETIAGRTTAWVPALQR